MHKSDSGVDYMTHFNRKVESIGMHSYEEFVDYWLLMHRSDDVDNMKHFDGELGRQAWTDSNGEGICYSLDDEEYVDWSLITDHAQVGRWPGSVHCG